MLDMFDNWFVVKEKQSKDRPTQADDSVRWKHLMEQVAVIDGCMTKRFTAASNLE